MTINNKGIIHNIISWAAFYAVTILLVAAPSMYLKTHGGTTDGILAACGAQDTTTSYQKTTAEEIILDQTTWQQQWVMFTGQLEHSQSQNLYYVRGGLFLLPLDLSQCQNLQQFSDDMLVVVKGYVLMNNGQPIIYTNGLRQIAPPILQTFYNAGAVSSIVASISLLYGFVLLVTSSIRSMKRKAGHQIKEPGADQEKKGAGANSVMLGIIAVPLWFMNPVVGIVSSLFGIVVGASGLRSPKRTTSLVGLIFCLVAFVFMAFFFVSLGKYNEAYGGTFYLSSAADATTKPTGQELLEIEPYYNKQYQISLHAPKGWTADESGTNGPQVEFKGPLFTTIGDQPLYIKLTVAIVPAQGQDTPTVYSSLKDQLSLFQDFATVEESDGVLAGGRLGNVHFFELTYSKNDIKSRGVGFATVVNDVAYIVVGSSPAESWNQYEPAFRQSLTTFETGVGI